MFQHRPDLPHHSGELRLPHQEGDGGHACSPRPPHPPPCSGRSPVPLPQSHRRAAVPLAALPCPPSHGQTPASPVADMGPQRVLRPQGPSLPGGAALPEWPPGAGVVSPASGQSLWPPIPRRSSIPPSHVSASGPQTWREQSCTDRRVPRTPLHPHQGHGHSSAGPMSTQPAGLETHDWD